MILAKPSESQTRKPTTAPSCDTDRSRRERHGRDARSGADRRVPRRDDAHCRKGPGSGARGENWVAKRYDWSAVLVSDQVRRAGWINGNITCAPKEQKGTAAPCSASQIPRTSGNGVGDVACVRLSVKDRGRAGCVCADEEDKGREGGGHEWRTSGPAAGPVPPRNRGISAGSAPGSTPPGSIHHCNTARSGNTSLASTRAGTHTSSAPNRSRHRSLPLLPKV